MKRPPILRHSQTTFGQPKNWLVFKSKNGLPRKTQKPVQALMWICNKQTVCLQPPNPTTKRTTKQQQKTCQVKKHLETHQTKKSGNRFGGVEDPRLVKQPADWFGLIPGLSPFFFGNPRFSRDFVGSCFSLPMGKREKGNKSPLFFSFAHRPRGVPEKNKKFAVQLGVQQDMYREDYGKLRLTTTHSGVEQPPQTGPGSHS